MQLTTMKALKLPDSTRVWTYFCLWSRVSFFRFSPKCAACGAALTVPWCEEPVSTACRHVFPTSPGTPWNGVGWRGNNINVWSLHQHSKHQGRVTCTLHLSACLWQIDVWFFTAWPSFRLFCIYCNDWNPLQMCEYRHFVSFCYAHSDSAESPSAEHSKIGLSGLRRLSFKSIHFRTFLPGSPVRQKWKEPMWTANTKDL